METAATYWNYIVGSTEIKKEENIMDRQRKMSEKTKMNFTDIRVATKKVLRKRMQMI